MANKRPVENGYLLDLNASIVFPLEEIIFANGKLWNIYLLNNPPTPHVKQGQSFAEEARPNPRLHPEQCAGRE